MSPPPKTRSCDLTGDPVPAKLWPGANLFRNPFGELTRSERSELAVVQIDDILDAIGSRVGENESIEFRPFCAYQMIGDCGRGKTTRMLALDHRFPSASYVYLPEDQPCPAIPLGSPLLIDEAQRLPWRVRHKIFSSGATLVLATHKDLTGKLRRSGYTVTTERIGLTLSPQQLALILNSRIEASRRDPKKPIPHLNESVADELIGRFGTDIRGIESYLYDIVQSQVNHHGEMRFID